MNRLGLQTDRGTDSLKPHPHKNLLKDSGAKKGVCVCVCVCVFVWVYLDVCASGCICTHVYVSTCLCVGGKRKKETSVN